MHPKIIPAIAACVLSTDLVLSQSSIPQVMQDVANIDCHVLTLTEQIRSYQGGLPAILPQVDTLSSVYEALQSGVENSGNLPKIITLEDAFNLVVQVNETLAIDNPVAIDALIEKKRLYKDAGVAGTLSPLLRSLLDGHEQFSQNIIDRLPPDTPPEAVDIGKQVVNVISEALRKGIKAFTQTKCSIRSSK